MERRDRAGLLPTGLTAETRLALWRRAARLVLWAEWVIAHSWAQLAVLAAACGVAMLGLVPPGVTGPCLLLAVTGTALAACARYERARPPRPSDELAERRLERDSALPHRPFAVLRDRPAIADQAGLWPAHAAAARAALARLRLRAPRWEMGRGDPYALRVGALVLLVAGLVTAGDRANERLLAAFIPGMPPLAGRSVVIQAWITPPAYTGLAPIFLTRDGVSGAAEGAAVDVPAGSVLSISVTGGGRKPWLDVPGTRVKFHAGGAEAWQTTAKLTESGTLRLRRFPFTLGRWALHVVPNTPPVADIPAPPGAAGKTTELKLPWHVAQRWGVAALTATLAPSGYPDLKPIILPVPLPGTPKDATGALQTDLTANPYAGVKMAARLTARDVSGQTGSSGVTLFTLPARNFKNGLARAIIDLRRRLALKEEGPADAADDLEALAQPPAAAGKAATGPAGDLNGHAGLFLNTVSIAARLREQPDAAGMAEVEQRLWIVALALDGALPEETQTALNQARAALRRALQDRALGKISPNDLARAMQALKQALERRLQDIARQAARDGKMPKPAPDQHYNVPSLDRLMRQIEQAARDGRTEDAEQKLAQLEQLMNQLKTARILSPEEAEAARQAAKQARQQSGAVQDMAQREAGLMDRAQSRAPRPGAMRRDMFPGAPPPPPSLDELEANEESRGQDANTQRALHQAVDALSAAFGPGGPGGSKVPKNLQAAGKDMSAAVDALKAGAEPAAHAAEAKAVEDLRKASEQMAQQQRSGGGQLALIPGGGASGQDGDEDLPGEDQPGDGTQQDPLGRPLHAGTGGKAMDDNSVHVPDGMEKGRSRAIQEELRRREADRARRQEELDYIGRLLKTY